MKPDIRHVIKGDNNSLSNKHDNKSLLHVAHTEAMTEWQNEADGLPEIWVQQSSYMTSSYYRTFPILSSKRIV